MFRRWFQRKSKGAAAPSSPPTPFPTAETPLPPEESGRPDTPIPDAACSAPRPAQEGAAVETKTAPDEAATATPESEPMLPEPLCAMPEPDYTLPAPPTDAERQRMVEEAAYFLSLERAPGDADPARDWAEAEALVAKRLG